MPKEKWIKGVEESEDKKEQNRAMAGKSEVSRERGRGDCIGSRPSPILEVDTAYD